jgi:hypothetical protein
MDTIAGSARFGEDLLAKEGGSEDAVAVCHDGSLGGTVKA